MWNQIAEQISKSTGEKFTISDRSSVGGGCINQSYGVSDGERTYFLKLNQASEQEMFIAEAIALQQMHETQTIRVPQPICWGTVDNAAYVVLEWLELGGRGGSDAWQEMGRKLAQMHRVGKAEEFGWERKNTIGATPQVNTWTANWADFFAEHRIGFQLRLAQRRGGNFGNKEKITSAVREWLADRQPQPSLLHGDLWSGNAAISSSGEPVILDPATYYGDREADLAMTELFGGFPAAFYRGYEEEWPLDPGYEQRKILYNLYHILNHFNLFGSGYASQASRMISQILRN